MTTIDRERFAAWNETMARKYDPDLYHTASPWPVRILERARVRLVLRLLEPGSGDRVLEVGCGAGNVLAAVPRGRLVGVDLSPFLLAKARARLGPAARLVRADAERLPFRPGSFDRIICSEVVEHVLSPSAVMKEMARIARGRAAVVVSFPNESLINRLKSFLVRTGLFSLFSSGRRYAMAKDMTDEWHLHAFSLDAFRKCLAEAGGSLDVDAIRAVPFASLLPLRFVVRLSPARAGARG